MLKTNHSFRRSELYELVWDKPLKQIAPDLGISDVALAKLCRKTNIPLPGRGHWAKLRASKETKKISLPPRFPGSPDIIEFTSPTPWNHDWKSDILNSPIPSPPDFPEDLESVKSRATDIIGNVDLPRLSDRTHPIIKKFLTHDEERKAEFNKYGSSWYEPKFESRIERRRLRILNAIFLHLQSLGCKPNMNTSKYDYDNRSASIIIAEQPIYFTLEAVMEKMEGCRKSQPSNKSLCLTIHEPWNNSTNVAYWADNEISKIEANLNEILIEFLFIAETQYRSNQIRKYEHLLELKSRLEDEERQRLIEEEKKEKERIEMQEKAYIDKLLQDAELLQKADTIRKYVTLVKSAEILTDIPKEAIYEWAEWALKQADKIDPIKNLSFLDDIHTI